MDRALAIISRADADLGMGLFDSIRWLFETQIKQSDTGEYHSGIMYGPNEDYVTRAELFRTATPQWDATPDWVWERED